MASFKSYGATINVADVYAEGHPLTAKEAAALNQLRTELISHRIRAGAFADLAKGDTASEELVAKAQAEADEIAKSFEFGAGRTPGEPRVTDPVEVEARDIARVQVKAAIAAAGLRLAKKGEEAKDGEYPFEKYAEKVAEVMKHPKVIEKAKKAVKARAGEEVEVEL